MKGLWLEPRVEYQCARCGIKFGATYPKFVERCPSCGAAVP